MLYDIHKGPSAKEVAKFVFPEPGPRISADRLSTKRVIDIAPVGDESIPKEMIDVLDLLAPRDERDPPVRLAPNTS